MKAIVQAVLLLLLAGCTGMGGTEAPEADGEPPEHLFRAADMACVRRHAIERAGRDGWRTREDSERQLVLDREIEPFANEPKPLQPIRERIMLVFTATDGEGTRMTSSGMVVTVTAGGVETARRLDWTPTHRALADTAVRAERGCSRGLPRLL